MDNYRKDAVCIELHYLPSIPYFALLSGAKYLVIEQHEHYQKRSFRNKTIIAAANGLLPLGIPLEKGKHQQQDIKETKIAWGEAWNHRHWQSIRSAYGNAPFFEHYAPFFEGIFQKKEQWLFDWNLKILQQIISIIGINIDITFTDKYQKLLNPEISDVRNSIGPRQLAFPIEYSFQSPAYPQVFMEKHGFLPDLSIIDLLFCQGPEALLYLEASLRQYS